MRMTHFRAARFCSVLVLAGALMAPGAAWAGDVKFGTEPLATDDKGAITAAGRKSATDEIPSEPGEEIWPLHVWAKLDKGAPGPLYVEFFGKLPDGKKYLAYRHEHGGYEGEKYVSMELDLLGNQGFNKGRTYNVELTQAGAKGNNIVLARGKITLAYTEPEAEPAGEGEGDADTDGPAQEGDTEAPADTADQDAMDTLAGGEEGNASDQGPPPVKKKGCAVDPAAHGLPGALVLFALGAGIARRRR